MTRPPDWAIRSARRLDLEHFGEQFSKSLDGSISDFHKVEAWQTYQEPDTKSLQAFIAGDAESALRLLREEADSELDVYNALAKKQVSFIRLRLIVRPMPVYLRWELLNYAVRSDERYGEDVRIVDLTGKVSRLPDEDHFDFLLFDTSRALVHDYGNDGLQVGGWLVEDQAVLVRLEVLARGLLSESVRLSESGFWPEAHPSN